MVNLGGGGSGFRFLSRVRASDRTAEAVNPAVGAGTPNESFAYRALRRRVEHDLDATVLLLAEDVVAVLGLAERDAVGDDEAGVDPAAADVVQQFRDVAVHVR